MECERICQCHWPILVVESMTGEPIPAMELIPLMDLDLCNSEHYRRRKIKGFESIEKTLRRSVRFLRSQDMFSLCSSLSLKYILSCYTIKYYQG